LRFAPTEWLGSSFESLCLFVGQSAAIALCARAKANY
jgi:hypothetical protein